MRDFQILAALESHRVESTSHWSKAIRPIGYALELSKWSTNREMSIHCRRLRVGGFLFGTGTSAGLG